MNQDLAMIEFTASESVAGVIASKMDRKATYHKWFCPQIGGRCMGIMCVSYQHAEVKDRLSEATSDERFMILGPRCGHPQAR